MRTPRIYTPQTLAGSSFVELEQQASHHINKVLRMQEGDSIILFNGDGFDYTARIDSIHKKSLSASINDAIVRETESPLSIHLGIGISKGDRMDWIMQKATELGVTAITPLFTERTEVRLKGERLEKKHLHWQQIIISACEQSGRSVLTKLAPATRIDLWTTSNDAEKKFVLHHRSTQSLDSEDTPKSIALLVGPEGGLSEAEIKAAEKQNFDALALGPRVLRTETAPLAALSVLQYLWGDF
jgi:16S rRNA (uracil1498-N3)-methyltransferase